MLSLVETAYTDPDSELLEDGDFCGHQPRKISVLECVHDGVVVPGPYYESGTSTKLYNVQNGAIESTNTRESSTPDSEHHQQQQQPQQQHTKQQQRTNSGRLESGTNEEDEDEDEDEPTASELGQSTTEIISSSSANHNHGIHVCPSGEKVSRTNLYIKGLPDSFSDEKLWNLPPDQCQIKSVKAATDDEGKCRGKLILLGKCLTSELECEARWGGVGWGGVDGRHLTILSEFSKIA
ncbi:unnamed protein product [Echinostoma caproni]|uniref:TFIIIC_sub6 domain-containing protein n=1 Tax=Echinostoma caproni TaxID=27848 RepID=A0A183BG23_9TREM|nr:unnamed protein product [Echinostoma caproni]